MDTSDPDNASPATSSPSIEAGAEAAEAAVAGTKDATCMCGECVATFRGPAIRSSICHCYACQKRTGSVFGVQCRFGKDDIVQATGPWSTYVRIGDAGSRIEYRFCSKCGSTVYWTLDAMPDIIAVAAGCFGDAQFVPTPVFSVYEDRMHSWVKLPEGIEHMH